MKKLLNALETLGLKKSVFLISIPFALFAFGFLLASLPSYETGPNPISLSTANAPEQSAKLLQPQKKFSFLSFSDEDEDDDFDEAGEIDNNTGRPKTPKSKFKIMKPKRFQLKYSVSTNSTTNETIISFQNFSITSITLENVEQNTSNPGPAQNTSKLAIGIESLEGENLQAADQQISEAGESVVQGFVVNLDWVVFDNARVEFKSDGEKTWKCKNWDFDGHSCRDGVWEFWLSTQPGGIFSFDLQPGDPGFAISSRNNAMMVYHNSTPTVGAPKYRSWAGTSATWSAGADALSLGASSAINWVDAKANPVRDEYVMVAVTNDSKAIAQVYSGGAWGNQITLSTTANAGEFGASIAFEQQGGDAIVVYNNASKDVPYVVWNGASWSSAASVLGDSCVGAGANWTLLFPRFNSDELMFVYSDGSARLCAQHWTGSAWDSQTNLENTSETFGNLGRSFSGAFEYASGRAVIVWESTSGSGSVGNIRYANWTGSGFSSSAAASGDVGSGVDWIECDSQKQSGSNNLACVLHEDVGANDDVNVGLWNGTGWTASTWLGYDGSIEGGTADGSVTALAFIGETSVFQLAYIDSGIDFPSVRTCDTNTNCDATTDFGTPTQSLANCGEASDAGFPVIAQDPFSNDTLVGWISQASWNKCTVFYNGTTNALSNQNTKLGSGRVSVAAGDSPGYALSFRWFNQKPWADNIGNNASGGQAYGDENSILYSSRWFDDVALDSYWLEHNQSGSFANTTPSSHSAFNSSWANITLGTTLGDAGKTIRARIWTNDTRTVAWSGSSDSVRNATDWMDILVLSPAPQFQWQQSNKTNSSEYDGETIRFFANFTDNNGTSQVVLTMQNANYTMSLWNGSAASGVWNYNLTLGAGAHYFNFTATDGMYASTSGTFSIVVAQNTTPNVVLHLNSSATDRIYAVSDTENSTANASGFLLQPEGAVALLRNGTAVANPTLDTFTIDNISKTFNYTLYYAATANYSSRSVALSADVLGLDDCGTITDSFTLRRNQTMLSPARSCFTIGANNAVLDGNGFTMSIGNDGGDFVSSFINLNGYNGTVVKNFVFNASRYAGWGWVSTGNSTPSFDNVVFNNTFGNCVEGETGRLVSISNFGGSGIPAYFANLNLNVSYNTAFCSPQVGANAVFEFAYQSGLKFHNNNITGLSNPLYLHRINSSFFYDNEINFYEGGTALVSLEDSHLNSFNGNSYTLNLVGRRSPMTLVNAGGIQNVWSDEVFTNPNAYHHSTMTDENWQNNTYNQFINMDTSSDRIDLMECIGACSLEALWTVHVKVVDNGMNPLQNANVTITSNATPSFYNTQLTNSSGFIAVAQNLSQFNVTATRGPLGEWSFLNAFNSTLAGYNSTATSVFIDSKQTITLMLQPS